MTRGDTLRSAVYVARGFCTLALRYAISEPHACSELDRNCEHGFKTSLGSGPCMLKRKCSWGESRLIVLWNRSNIFKLKTDTSRNANGVSFGRTLCWLRDWLLAWFGWGRVPMQATRRVLNCVLSCTMNSAKCLADLP